MSERLTSFIIKENDRKLKKLTDETLLRSRKEVEINGNGTTGYVIKEGSQKGRVLKHIQIPTKNLWKMKNEFLVHKHLIIRAEINKPPLLTSYLEIWLKKFIESINMKIFMGPYVKYCNMPGNRGITAVAIIETSHIAMHVWDEVSPALMQFDVYSCSELDPEEICKKIKKDFEITKIEYKFLNRETGLVDLK